MFPVPVKSSRSAVVRHQPVIRVVIDPPKTQRRAEMIPFRRMVVNHVQDHLDAGRMKVAHHLFLNSVTCPPVDPLGNMSGAEQKSQLYYSPNNSSGPGRKHLVVK